MTPNIMTVDQYNWFASQINSIVEVRPKNFNEYFDAYMLFTENVEGYMIPKNLYAFNGSLECIKNLGISILNSGDLPDDMASILEQSGSQLEIYTREYNITAKAAESLKYDKYYTVGVQCPDPAIYRSNADLMGGGNFLTVLDATTAGLFGPIVDSGTTNCSYYPDDVFTIVNSDYFTVKSNSKMVPYSVEVSSLSGISKSKTIIGPFEYDSQRVVPNSVINELSLNSYPGYYPLIRSGIYSGVLFDHRSDLIRNFSYRNTLDAPNDGVNAYIWHSDYFIPNDNPSLYGNDLGLFDVASQPILKNRHLIKNKNLYKILPYQISGFKWISVEDVKNKSEELNIPFVFRRASSSYEFSSFNFSIAEPALEYVTPHSLPTGSNENSYNWCTTALDAPINSGVNEDASLIYNYSHIQIQTEGTHGESTFNSTIWIPDIHPAETGFFTVNTGGCTGCTGGFSGNAKTEFNFNSRGYIPWVYQAPNFVFSETGNWCVPFSNQIHTGLKPLIHHLSSVANFKMYRYDLIKTQTKVGGTVTSSPIYHTSSPVLRSPYSNKEDTTVGECFPHYIFTWQNCLSKFSAAPIFEIDAENSYKEQLAYADENLNPKNCFIQDYSSETAGKIEKVLVKKLGTFKFTPPSGTGDGVGLSLMRGYGPGGGQYILENFGEDHEVFVATGSSPEPVNSQLPYYQDPARLTLYYRGKLLPIISSMPEIDLNYFTKDISINTEGHIPFVENFSGEEKIIGEDYENIEDGGIYSLGFFIKDSITAD